MHRNSDARQRFQIGARRSIGLEPRVLRDEFFPKFVAVENFNLSNFCPDDINVQHSLIRHKSDCPMTQTKGTIGGRLSVKGCAKVITTSTAFNQN
jgi:hypothetical protein